MYTFIQKLIFLICHEEVSTYGAIVHAAHRPWFVNKVTIEGEIIVAENNFRKNFTAKINSGEELVHPQLPKENCKRYYQNYVIYAKIGMRPYHCLEYAYVRAVDICQ